LHNFYQVGLISLSFVPGLQPRRTRDIDFLKECATHKQPLIGLIDSGSPCSGLAFLKKFGFVNLISKCPTPVHAPPTNFHRRLLHHRPALTIILLILLQARINTTILDLSNILQHRQRLLTPRPRNRNRNRNRITNLIVAIMRKSPIPLPNIITGSNINNSTCSNIRCNIHLRLYFTPG
jgi:hypothetical protein